MTTAEDVLTELEERGVELRREGDRLRYRAPAGVMTPELRALVAEHRAALLRLQSETTAVSEETKGSKASPYGEGAETGRDNEGGEPFGTFSFFIPQAESDEKISRPEPEPEQAPVAGPPVDRVDALARLRAVITPSLRRWSDDDLLALVGWPLLLAFNRGGETNWRRYLPPRLASLTDDELAALVHWPTLAAMEAAAWHANAEVAEQVHRGGVRLARWWNARSTPAR